MLLYHLKPGNMKGDVLYPLNQLKDVDLESYETGISKYSFRKDLMDVDIPIANCKWNDVIHLCPVDMSAVISQLFKAFENEDAIKELDFNRYSNLSYFLMPSETLDENNLFVYLKYECLDRAKLVQEDMAKNVFKWSDAKDKLSSETTKAQIEYFKQCASDLNKIRYLFTAIPHVFYKGNIDIAKCEIRTLNI